MQSVVEIVEEAKEISLLTLHDAKVALNLVSVTTADTQVEMMIRWASDEIATMCNRTLAQETVIETILELDSPRLCLSHYPVKQITEINDGGTILSATDYIVDAKSGIITRLSGVWGLPVVIKYTGGYDLPKQAPPALAAAALIMSREAYYASLRGDATVRMISHKHSRVMFFDPNVLAKGASAGGGTAGSAARRTINNLVLSYTRFEV
jgi:hypothetical protein